jgi:ribosome maturation factor RimP
VARVQTGAAFFVTRSPSVRAGKREDERALNLVSENARTDQVVSIIEPSLADLGYELVRLHFGGNGRPVLQIMLDRADGEEITIDDCTLASRTISVLLDVADPIPEAYELEVGSAGIDRPLTREKDFDSFAGFEAKVELKQARDGRRRFRGRLLGLKNGMVRLRVEEGEDNMIELPFADVSRAKLVLTDELIDAAQKGRLNEG